MCVCVCVWRWRFAWEEGRGGGPMQNNLQVSTSHRLNGDQVRGLEPRTSCITDCRCDFVSIAFVLFDGFCLFFVLCVCLM